MKWDIENSRYASFWKSEEGKGAFQLFLDADIIHTNYTYWQTQFYVDPNITIRQQDGTATYSVKMKKLNAVGVLNWRAPFSDTFPRDKTGFEFNTGSIPDFAADAYVETAAERDYKEKMLEEYFGNDREILLNYANELQTQIDEADQTLNFLSASLISKGKTEYPEGMGKGIHGDISEAKIPDANRTHAVNNVWTDTNAKLFTEMITIQNNYKDLWGVTMPMKWQIPYDMYVNTFLKNDEVKEYVRYIKSLDNVLLPDNLPMTDELFRLAASQFEGLAPIEIMVEKEKGQEGMVHGWADNVAVYRPAGYAGPIKHTNIADQRLFEKYGNKLIDKVFAKAGPAGLYTFANTTLPNGMLKEWRTDLFVAAVPVLEEFLYHVIVDTSTIGE